VRHPWLLRMPIEMRLLVSLRQRSLLHNVAEALLTHLAIL
jgi:hypothetical protein